MTTIDLPGFKSQDFGKGTSFGPGPWADEQLDKAQWVDQATGLDCLIVRNAVGALCGYVGVDETHPWFGKDYNQCLKPDCNEEYCYEHSAEAKISVHGGITFSGKCDEDNPEGICHVPEPGQPAKVFWFGFDCAHAGDVAPALESMRDYGTYKGVPYVVGECQELAKQLAAVA